MGEKSPKPASTPTGAVFLSYASQDAGAARKICDALCAAGIEVWFDQSELRGGDAWDLQIRQQIHDCRLFIPVISATSERRDEGYFRREWSLAVDRTRDMAHTRAFLLPVVIDDTPERGASVPEKFHELQWTRLPAGETPADFVRRVQRLLSPEPSTTNRPAASKSHEAPAVGRQSRASWRSNAALVTIGSLCVLVTLAYFVEDRFRVSKHPVLETTSHAATVAGSGAPLAANFAPPPYSLAVLPLINLSGDPKQEYFSDGMTEELITALSQLGALKVIARTSAFSFKGKNVDVGTIARVLNVASVLEGSIRRSGSTVRVTVQLINGRDGFHIWSQDYDRALKNVLALQSEIATTVAQQLQATLVTDEPGKIEAGGTQNTEAYDAFLLGRELLQRDGELPKSTALLEKAVRLDPNFARAWAQLALAYSENSATSTIPAAWFARARTAADTALKLNPQLLVAHTAMVWVASGELDWGRAEQEMQAAESLDATSPETLHARGNLDFRLGRWSDAIAAIRTSINRDPLRLGNYGTLSVALSATGQHQEAAQTLRQAQELEPHADLHASIARELLLDHRPEEALVEAKLASGGFDRDQVLAMTYFALERREDSDRLLAAIENKYGSTSGHMSDIAEIHAFRGETDVAFQWLDRALDAHDPVLSVIKGNIGIYPNINTDPRYRAILRRLKLPE
jgi:TolB-like protein